MNTKTVKILNKISVYKIQKLTKTDINLNKYLFRGHPT